MKRAAISVQSLKSEIRNPSCPVVLSIAGSDSSGGAGIQTDLKTFASLGCYGTTAVTCITAQNPSRITAVQAVSAQLVRGQIDRVAEAFPLGAAKTGMLYSASLVRAVAAAWKGPLRGVPLVIDPVMVSTSGHVLLKPEAVDAVRAHLFPNATIVTPNREEAALLLGRSVRTLADVRRAARELSARHGVPFLVKGGHLRGRDAIDVLCADGKTLVEFSSPRVAEVRLHGTGCTLSAAITAGLAHGQSLAQAVQTGKDFITQAIRRRLKPGTDELLNTLP